ncbi:MAG: hypothetical protein EA368_09665 [Leptolyngbya sp. DLM2.Bin27]|nr:MAG: hypothetical protein EA368_09665 [Leptolyngbya sp. DLM2.Bin27]
MQAVWDSITAEQVYLDLTNAQQQELDCGVDAYDTDAQNVLAWDEVESSN